MKTRTKFSLIIAIALVAIIAACNKSVNSSSSGTVPDKTMQQQVMNATNSLYMFSQSDDAGADIFASGNGDLASSCRSDCATITIVPSKDVYPHTKTLDFSNCPDQSGKIIITVYQPLEGASGLYSTTAYDNYYDNGVHVEGTVRTLVTGGVITRLIDKTFTDSSGDVRTWHGKFTITSIQFNGEEAKQITGFGHGQEIINGEVVQHIKATIDENNPVIRLISCCTRAKGSITANLISAQGGGKPLMLDEVLDYGDGTCDDAATLSINGGAPMPITLPLVFWPLH